MNVNEIQILCINCRDLFYPMAILMRVVQEQKKIIESMSNWAMLFSLSLIPSSSFSVVLFFSASSFCSVRYIQCHTTAMGILFITELSKEWHTKRNKIEIRQNHLAFSRLCGWIISNYYLILISNGMSCYYALICTG